MSRYFDNDFLFDEQGCLTGPGLDALQNGTLDELGRLDAAEHLTFCDICLLRYTELTERLRLSAPMRDLVPQVQGLMRLRSFRIMTNRYVNVAAAVVLAFALWQFGAFRVPAAPQQRQEPAAQPRFSISQAMGSLHKSVYGGLSGWMDSAQNSLDQLRDNARTPGVNLLDQGGLTARGE